MRPIRVLVAILGLDPQEAGAIAVARLLRDAGMEVIYLGCSNGPTDLLEAAVEEGVDVIGLSCHSWENLHSLDSLLALLRQQDLDIPAVVVGSVVPTGDARTIAEKGVAAVLGPTSDADQIVETIQRLAASRRDR